MPGATGLPWAADAPGRDFFTRPAVAVAPGLLGWVLEHQTADGLVSVELTEVEAYAGEGDPASHSYRGPTARNAVMFGDPGYAYVYFTYGMHYCVNVSCQPAGTASAVLLRAGRVVAGEELARSRRGAPGSGAAASASSGAGGRVPARGARAAGDARAVAARDLARGPGRLCRALGVTRAENGLDLCDDASPLRLRPGAAATGEAGPEGTVVPVAGTGGVSSGPRVGVSSAAEVPWRFWVTGDPTVSAYRRSKPRPR